MLQDNIILKKVIVHVSQPSIGKYKASEECIDSVSYTHLV